MSLAMTKQERERFWPIFTWGSSVFLKKATHCADLVFVRAGRRTASLQRAGRFSLCAQTETPPYKYVSVEGPVVAIEPADLERDRRPLARRYFGAELGDRYIEGTRDLVENLLVRVRPERWRTVDYTKQNQSR